MTRSQLLFMAAMTLVDSVDSILMLYSYAGFPERSWALFERSTRPGAPDTVAEQSIAELQGDKTVESEHLQSLEATLSLETPTDKSEPDSSPSPDQLPTTISNPATPGMNMDSRVVTDTRAKMNVMSGLSIILTLMSILVAFG